MDYASLYVTNVACEMNGVLVQCMQTPIFLFIFPSQLGSITNSSITDWGWFLSMSLTLCLSRAHTLSITDSKELDMVSLATVKATVTPDLEIKEKTKKEKPKGSGDDKASQKSGGSRGP